MEKYRYYSLSGLKVFIDRVSSNEIYFTIFKFKKNHWLWGEIWERCSLTECIQLSLTEEDRSGPSLRTGYLGRLTTIPIYIKNIHTFDLNSHCDLLIDNFLKAKENAEKLKAAVSEMLNN